MASNSTSSTRTVTIRKPLPHSRVGLQWDRDANGDLCIGRVEPNGLAHRMSCLQKGTKVLKINGLDVARRNPEAVRAMLKIAEREISLQVVVAPITDKPEIHPDSSNDPADSQNQPHVPRMGSQRKRPVIRQCKSFDATKKRTFLAQPTQRKRELRKSKSFDFMKKRFFFPKQEEEEEEAAQ